MSIVKAQLTTFHDNLMVLYMTEISLEVLVESNCAKTVKYLQDYCRCYQRQLPELVKLSDMCEQILQKWKNYVSYTIFDESKDNMCEFIKTKRESEATSGCLPSPPTRPTHSKSTGAARQ